MQEKTKKMFDNLRAIAFTVCNMKQDLNLAQRIRALKAGKPFMVATEKERQSACRIAKNLRDAGVIEFDVVTKKEGDAFKVAAI